MEPDFKDLLAEYKDELTHFQSDDILVNIQSVKVLSTEEVQEMTLAKTQRILKNAQAIFREIGVQPFCQSSGVVHWEKQGKKVATVVYLRDVPLSFRRTKAILVGESDQDFFMNPYFERWFRANFDQNPPSFENRQELLQIFESSPFTYDEDVIYFGNFHPQRYELLKEFEDISSCDAFSRPIKRILGHAEQTELLPMEWSLSAPYLFEFDPDQAAVIHQLNHDSVTVQGPPGTGKSQVISNILGACLMENKQVLVVSEKKSALQVIQQKLSEQNLGFLCSHLSFHAHSHAFYEDLKMTWEKLSQVPIQLEKKWLTFDQSSVLEKQFLALKRTEKELGLPFMEFQKKQPNKTVLSTFYSLPVPTLSSWQVDKKMLQELNASSLALLPFLHKSWLELSSFTEHQKLVQTIMNVQGEVANLFDLSSLDSIQKSLKMAVVCQQFQGAIYEKYGHLLGKEIGGLQRKLKKWKALNASLELLDLENQHWKQEPSFAELEVLKSASQEKGWLSKLRWNRLWKTWTRTPELNPLTSIASKEKQLSFKTELKKQSASFDNLGIASLELELPVLEQLLQSISMNDWTWYQSIDGEKRTQMAKANRLLNDYLQAVKTLFTLKETDLLASILKQLSMSMDTLRVDLNRLQGLSIETFELLKTGASMDEIDSYIHQTHWNTFVSVHPYMLDFEWNTFKQQFKKQLKRIQQEGKELSNYLVEHQAQKFAAYQRILTVPLSKLNDEEKAFRATLRKGKSILVKEFAKTRNHLSIRELRSCEAKHWVDVLKPIQLSNPSSLASIFTMEKDQFDLVIFDEAGQIPMSYALGALQRAKRVLIAGDHQQMSPSSYFRQREDVVVDLLHQSAYYLPNVMLTHHYRSRDERLIAFSNAHFYGGRLRTFSDQMKEENTIQWTHVPNGIYSEGINLMEAKVVAQLVEKALMSQDKYGVVAFSETQLNAIQSSLTPKGEQKLEEAIENGQFFFKALEQVQGEECDHLIVGFGYGKNPEGKFELRFGPINLKNGEKRLNVLFSRARKSIHFISSVQHADFTQTKNEGVQRLKDWFLFIEEQGKVSTKDNPATLSFESLFNAEDSFLSFLNRYRVLSQRNWNLS